jgi:formate-dependent nitrite reductase membrane component NrfD
MEELTRVIYNAPHEIYLEWPIAVYFFIAGMSAAAFILSTIMYFFDAPRYKSLTRLGYLLSLLLIGLAPLFLILDLLHPTRFVHLFYMFNFNSPVTWGTVFLMLYFVNCFVSLVFDIRDNAKMVKVFGVTGILLALGVSTYTGFLLALSKGIALWNTPLMPVYFLISALISGTAFLIFVSIMKETLLKNSVFFAKFKIDKDVIIRLSRVLLVLIMIDLFVVFSQVVMLYYTSPENFIAATLLLEGQFRNLFLIVEIALGLVLPVVVLLIPGLNRNTAVLTIISILVLIGIWGMRYTTVIAGQYVPLM